MKRSAFTLAELLIALAILGIIATFTIPKVLTAQNNTKYNSMAKEMIAALSQAYDTYKLQNQPSAGTIESDLTPYLNYVRIDTISTIDDRNGMTTSVCSNTYPCYFLANGAALQIQPGASFSGTNATNAITFLFDPDGKVTDASTNGPGKSVFFFLYYNGMIRTRDTILPNTTSSAFVYSGPCGTGCDPSWFSWN